MNGNENTTPQNGGSTNNKGFSSLIGMFEKKQNNNMDVLSLNSEININNNNTLSHRSHTEIAPPKTLMEESSILKRARNMENKSKTTSCSDNIQSSTIISNDTITTTTTTNTKTDSQNEHYIHLQPTTIPSNVYNPSFCEAFFIASIPQENAQPIPNSENLSILCNHSFCTKLPSIKPDIIFKYPSTSSIVEINTLTASMCFPEGIKVCYGNPNDEQENPPFIQEIITNVTNQSAEKFYLITSTFYYKLLNEQYIMQYKSTSATIYKEERFKQISEKQNETINKKSMQSIEYINTLYQQTYVYIPFCVAMISRYPYINQIKTCLISIKHILSDYRFKVNEIVALIKHLTREIPVPLPKTHIRFYMPFVAPIEITCPYIQDYPLLNNNVSCILSLKPEMIVIVFKLLIYEQRMLFVDDDISKLFNYINSFILLMYPFQWVNPLIPIMTVEMVKYMNPIVPFVYGMKKNMYKRFKKENGDVFKMKDSIYIVKTYNNEIMYLVDGEKQKINLPHLPNDIDDMLIDTLRELHKKKIAYDNCNNSSNSSNSNNDVIQMYNELEIKTRMLFYKVLFFMFVDIPSYINVVDNNYIFSEATFLDRHQTGRNSYKKIFAAQNFQMFVQNTITNEKGMFFYQRKKQNVESDERFEKIFGKTETDYVLHVIQPPFIKDETISTPDKYESTINKLYPIEGNKYILPQLLNLNKVDCNFENISYYKYPDKEILTEPPKKQSKMFTGKIKFFNNLERKNKNKTVINKKKNTGELTEEEIKEALNEMLIKVFSSKELVHELDSQSAFFTILETQFAKEYFVQAIYQEGKIESSKIINSNSISFFLKVLYYLLNEFFNIKNQCSKNLKLGIRIILASQVYYSCLDSNEKIYIFNFIIAALNEHRDVLLSEAFINEFIQVKMEAVNIKGFNKNEREIYFEECRAMIVYDVVRLFMTVGFEKEIIFELVMKVVNAKIKNNGSKERLTFGIQKVLGLVSN